MQDRDKLYIDGGWVPSAGSGTIDVVNATTEEVMGRVPEGAPEDVDKAVAAARRAFETWSSTPVEERAKFLQLLHEGLNARMQEIAETITGEVGMPMVFSQMIQAGLPAMVMGSYVDIANQFPFEEQIGNSLVVREPLGRGRLHHPVELPAAPDRGQGRARARSRVHGRAEAERGGAAQRVHPRRDRRRRRASGRRVQPRHRHRAGRGRGDRGASRRRHGVVHGLHACGQAGGGACRPDREEGDAASSVASRRSSSCRTRRSTTRSRRGSAAAT